MKTMIFSSEIGTWKELLSYVTRLIGFGNETRTGRGPVFVVYPDAARATKALLTIRMALNPGETYSGVVAARIRREAAAYEEYLRNPTKIGRIVLNVKEFAGPGSATCVSREQYRINQPAEGLTDSEEGHASVYYRFARSRNKVLEFIVHDENDKPLFPLVRTYTNWTGSKELDLGKNRTLYLTAEGESDYVNVRAGFTPASAAEEVIDFVPRPQPRAIAACAGTGNTSTSTPGSPFYSLAFRQPANAIAFSVVTLILLLSNILFFQQLNLLRVNANVDKNPARLSGVLPGVGALTVPQVSFGGDSANNSVTGKFPTRLPAKKDTLLRLADIRRFKVSIDRKSCEGRCLKLLNGIQRRLKSRLDGLNLPPAAPESAALNKPSAKLVVSYLPLDAERGKIHITLSDDESSLWNADFNHALSDHAQIPDSYSEQLSTAVLLTVFRAKDHCLSEADGGLTPTELTK